MEPVTSRYVAGESTSLSAAGLLRMLVNARDESYPVRVSSVKGRLFGWARTAEAERYCRSRSIRFRRDQPIVVGNMVLEWTGG